MSPLRVLSVADDASLEAICDHFEATARGEFELLTASRVEKALSILDHRDTDIDCIVSGSPLPDADPLAFLDVVRERDGGVPFVLFAADGSAEQVRTAFDAGVTDYLRDNGSSEQYELLVHRVRDAVSKDRDPKRTLEDIEQAIEYAADAIFITDTEGTIEYANRAFEELTGFSTEEAIGSNPRILKSGEQPQSYYERMWDAILEGNVWEEEVINERKSGEQYYAHQTIAPLVDDDGTVEQFVAIQRDVTERRLLEEQIEQSATVLSKLHDVTTELDRDPKEKLDRILEIGTEYLEFPIGYVTNIEAGTQKIIAAAGDHDLIQPGQTDQLGQTYCRATIESETPVLIEDAITDDRWADDPAFERFGLRCYVGAKIVVDGEVYGTLCFGGEEPRYPVLGEMIQSTVEALSQWVGYELERHQYERELERYEEIVENVPVGVYRNTPGPEGTFLEVNQAIVDMFDAETKAELLDTPTAELYREPNRRSEFSERLSEHGEIRNEVLELQTLDGKPFYGSVSAIKREDEDGTVYFDGIIQDVTVRERAKEELAQSRKRLQVLFDQSPDGIIVHDDDGAIVDVNETQLEQLGYDRDELLSMSVADIEDGISIERLQAVWSELDAEETLKVEGEHRRTDGTTYPVEVWVTRIEFDDEPRFLALSRDITERKERQREIERARTQLRQVIDLVPDLIFAKTRDGEYILANESVAEVYDRPVEEIIGSTDRELLESETAANRFREADLEVIETGEPKHIPEQELVTSDGETLVLETRKIPFELAGTNEQAVLGYARDITEIKEQRDRLELLNQVVRHDVRNDMQVVRGRAQLLDEYVDGEAKHHLEEVLESADAAIDLTKTARDLTETLLTRDEETKPVALRYVLESRIDVIRSRYSNARISIDGVLPDVEVLADEMLESVVDNLLVNAIVHNDADVPKVTVSVDQPDDRAVVAVADNGPGIADDRKEEIFGKGEKGFDSPGTGLGLYLVQTLTDQYGGDVWVEDNDPTGSVFKLSLPLAGDD